MATPEIVARLLRAPAQFCEELNRHPTEVTRHNGENVGNAGALFSRKAAMPSTTSGPEKPRLSSASEASKIGPAVLSQLFNEYLVHRIELCAPAASFFATSRAVS